MPPGPLLFPHSSLQLLGIRITPPGVTLVAEPAANFAFCPTCGQRSVRVHSHYQRRLADLPAQGRAVCIELHLRRFFCDLPDCPRITFAERLPYIANAHARKTIRLDDALQRIAFTAGGEAGSRLAGQLNMPASGDTLLRLIRRSPPTSNQDTPQVLGVDDWALRRGQVYGTILCDLELRRPVDLLPERSSQVLVGWLEAHPGVQIISRDRGGDYAKGATLGAPQALQVADRWHLLRNLTDALQRAVHRRCGLVEEVTKAVATLLASIPSPPTPEPEIPPAPSRLSRAQQKKEESRQRRLARYQQVRERVDQGQSLRKIGRTLGMNRETVRRLARSEQFPERRTPTPRALPIDKFLPYLKQRWQDGCDNTAQLYQEIKKQGFRGSVYTVRRQIRRWRRIAGRRPRRGQELTVSPPIIRPSARRITWLALGHVREPTAQDMQILQGIFHRWPQLQETAELCRQFALLLKEHDAESLEAWAQLAGEPGILPEVRRFAEVLRQDWAAVVQAVRQPWSQGQVEGQINRLKLIKRQMYGRANFDLLRQRVLSRPEAQRQA